MEKWPTEKVFELIGLYQKNTFLWNVYDPNYHKEAMRKNTLAEIATILGNSLTGNFTV